MELFTNKDDVSEIKKILKTNNKNMSILKCNTSVKGTSLHERPKNDNQNASNSASFCSNQLYTNALSNNTFPASSLQHSAS